MADNYLVTGSRGGSTPHVTSSQARNFNAGIVGGDRYVMEGLECTVSSANKVHVSPGVACFCGADVEVPPGGADLTIENGSQGMKRNDLVVLRYESGSPEKVTLAVIKGTPAASSPADPSYNEGDIRDGDSPVDMPLWRIPLDGISVGSPVPLYNAVPSMAELRDSVSQFPEIQVGVVYSVDVLSGTYTDVPVVFERPFAATPKVFCSLRTASPYSSYGSINPVPVNASTEGFTIRLYNDADKGAEPSINWLAVL